MHYTEVSDPYIKELLSSLFWMVVQYTSPDDVPENAGADDQTAERTTFPYSALSNSVYILDQYRVLTILGGVGRVVTFKFNDGVFDWMSGI